MAGLWSDLLGSTKSFFRIGKTGPRLKDSSGNLLVRNPGDSADAAVTASLVNVSGNDIVLNSDAAESGADWKLTLRRNTAATESIIVIYPADDGTDGQALRRKAGSSAGAPELEWFTPTSGTGSLSVDTTSLAFGSSSPVTMFTLPAAAIIDKIQVVIDTAFDGTPTMSVGISGQTSKYSATSDVDLNATAATVFEIHPGLAAPGGGGDALILTYAAGGATAGAARVLVYYVDSPA